MLKRIVNCSNDFIENKIPDALQTEKLKIKPKVLSFNKKIANHLDESNNRLFKINSQLFYECLHLFEKKSMRFPRANSQIYQLNNDSGLHYGGSFTFKRSTNRSNQAQMTERKGVKRFKAAIKKPVEPFTRSMSNTKSLLPVRFQRSLLLSDNLSCWYKNSMLLNGSIEHDHSMEKSHYPLYDNEPQLFPNQKIVSKLYEQFTKKNRFNWNESFICRENELFLEKCDPIVKEQKKEDEKEIEKNNVTPMSSSSAKNILLNRSTNHFLSAQKSSKTIQKMKVMLCRRDIPPLYNTKSQVELVHIYTLLSINDEVQEGINSYYSKCLMNNIVVCNDQEFTYMINKSYREHFEEYFQHRTNWTMVNRDSKQINFQWKYFSRNVNYRKCLYEPQIPSKRYMMANLFENNNEVGNKRNFFINFVKYCNKININPFEIIPFTVIISNGRLFDLTIGSLEELITYLNNYIKTSTTTSQDNKNKGIYLNRLYKDHFINDYFNNNDKTPIYIPLPYMSNKNYWILKPVDLYKGMGIQICDNIGDIKKLAKKILIGVDTSYKILEKEDNENMDDENNDEEDINNKKGKPSHIYCSSQLIVQKYLDHPLLYQQRKFDIRCFVLVDHNLNVFYCKEGHLKGCSIPYDLESSLCPFAHITNYSFQKHSQDFEKYEHGNEMSYQNFKDFLQSQHISLKYFDLMIQRMKYAIEISMNSIGSKLYKKTKTLSFEIFGYDFIIDKNFVPWILEINNNPGLGISSPVIAKIVPRMIDDAFRLTLDTVFETRYAPAVFDPETMEYKSKYHLDGYNDTENVFEFLCNINKPPV